MKDQEVRAKKREEKHQSQIERLEAKIDKLEDLVYRLMHRGNIALSRQESELTRYDEGVQTDFDDAQTPPPTSYSTEGSAKQVIASMLQV